MKTIISILLIFSSTYLISQNVDSGAMKTKPIYYKAWVKGILNEPNYKGYLYDLNDSIVILQDLKNPTLFTKIDIEKISKLSFRKEGRIWKGFGLGLLFGFSAGAIVGLNRKIDDSKNNFISLSPVSTAIGYGAFAALPGGIIGAFVGGAKIKIPIHGSREYYLKQKKKLKQYSIH